MAIAADLNRVGKRPRSSSGTQAVTPLKRRQVEDGPQKQTPSLLQSTSRRSATSLRSRRSLPVSSPVTRSHGPEVYDAPQSPEQSAKNRSSPTKSQGEKKPLERKVLKRKLNRKVDKPLTGTKAFDRRRQGAINPLSVPGVNLTTFDSPGKNTRAKRQGPLRKLDIDYLKLVAVDAEPEREASPELGGAYLQEVPFPSGQAEQYREGSKDGSEQPQDDDKGPETNRVRLTDTEAQHGPHRRTHATRSGDVEASENSEEGIPRQQVTDQDRNYLMRTYENNAREEQQAAGKSSREGRKATSQVSPAKVQGKESRIYPPSSTQYEENGQEEDSESDEVEAQPEVSKKKSRKKMSEEEKRTKAEEKARIRQENAVETEAADARDFDTRGKEFVDGIEDLVGEIGGLSVWSKMGAGAKTITSMVARKKSMDGARAQTIWKKLTVLKDVFSGQEDASEERVDHLIRSLQAKSTWLVLTRGKPIQPDDTTIVDLYEQIIPQSVYVLSEQVRGRFFATHLFAWQELQSLLEIAISLCDVATDWQPKPTNLETGIRQHVRHSVRPSLVVIHNTVKGAVASLTYKEQRERENEAFRKRQAMKKEEKRRAWERMNQQCAAASQSPQPQAHLSSQPASQRARSEAVRATYTTQIHQPVANLSRKTTPPPPLRRRPTEEIPAPDPNTSWNEVENVALLNGLQKYLDDDRYSRILEDPKFAKALKGKDVEQCMSRAVFFQAGCSQILKETADAGDSSFDWLRSV